MSGQHLAIELAHPDSGHIKRIRISYKSLKYLLGTVLVLSAIAVGGCSSYLRMVWKVTHYEQLRADFDRLRNRYKNLEQVSKEHTKQIASLESLASEVSAAYGINQPDAGDATPMDNDFAAESGVKESIKEYNFLKSASFSRIYHNYPRRWQSNVLPGLWPVAGVLRSSFGGRMDPLSGEGGFHTGVDLSAPSGTQVHVTADGVVASAGWSGHYGKLVVVDHGNGIETYYAHLSQFFVVPGQEVRSNEAIALTGGTGRVTGPHLHYEIRVAGTPVNPYKYLNRSEFAVLAKAASSTHSDLGL